MNLDLEAADENDILDLDDVLELPEEERPRAAATPTVAESIGLNELSRAFDFEAKGLAEDRPTDPPAVTESRLPTAAPAYSETTADAAAAVEEEYFPRDFDAGGYPPPAPQVEPDVDAEAVAPPPAPTVAAAAGAPEPAIEDLVRQIEMRLVEAVQQVVAARLPDIVRGLLREEIERIKKETAAD